jgi:hypothetical protein
VPARSARLASGLATFFFCKRRRQAAGGVMARRRFGCGLGQPSEPASAFLLGSCGRSPLLRPAAWGSSPTAGPGRRGPGSVRLCGLARRLVLVRQRQGGEGSEEPPGTHRPSRQSWPGVAGVAGGAAGLGARPPLGAAARSGRQACRLAVPTFDTPPAAPTPWPVLAVATSARGAASQEVLGQAVARRRRLAALAAGCRASVFVRLSGAPASHSASAGAAVGRAAICATHSPGTAPCA